MALGELLRQARLDAGLSQRELCGDTITRNMLSQIENGGARPSMDTLRYLASRLGKPVAYFLEEASPEDGAMEKARKAYAEGNFAATLELVRDIQHREEGALLYSLAAMGRAEQVFAEGRLPYAAALLKEAARPECMYYTADLERRRLLLLSKADPEALERIAKALPEDDEMLLLRARAALAEGDPGKAARLLDAAEDCGNSAWCLLRGECWLAAGEYARAIACFAPVEEQALPQLERCYAALGDYQKAYFYAKRQREGR